MSVVVVAHIRPLPEHLDAVREAFLEILPAVHEEPGCELYALHEADGVLVMVEKWESQEALDVHMTAPALAGARPEAGRQGDRRPGGPGPHPAPRRHQGRALS